MVFSLINSKGQGMLARRGQRDKTTQTFYLECGSWKATGDLRIQRRESTLERAEKSFMLKSDEKGVHVQRCWTQPKTNKFQLNHRKSALLHLQGSCKQRPNVLAFHKSHNLSLLWFIPPTSRVWTGSDNWRCQTRKTDSVECVREQPANFRNKVVALF